MRKMIAKARMIDFVLSGAILVGLLAAYNPRRLANTGAKRTHSVAVSAF